ncbi:MAG: CRISPR-associated protein Csx16 [Candidatus Accumulibacter meliphilus]|uniref:CRISPR-associated protein Csx16 n=1 Tax=Candidatus Accumulibacter meliphilus TaxID=2211374 RepID=A0A369XP37_9PROT|nr:MAG: CRISPR-associated protein Csx16 [Candidatus Accumulibacter meliphilus]
MTIWFVSRHPGAVAWAQRQGIAVDRQLAHLDPQQVATGDTVIGTLPINLAAEVCARGARYYHLTLRLPSALRGTELDADQLEQLGACIEAYLVERRSP